MWSEHEIAIAKQLNEPSTKSFLKKVFVDIVTNKGEILEKNIASLDDAEYGRLMKIIYFSREENKAKLNMIAKISNQKPETDAAKKATPAIAPK